MASLPHVPRIRPVRRWLAWQGTQRPLVGIELPSFTPIALLENPSQARAEWSRTLDAASELRLDLVMLPSHLASAPDLLGALIEDVARRGLACLLPLDAARELPALPDWGGLIVGLRLHNKTTDADVLGRIEGDLGDRLRAARLPLAVAATDPIMGAGPALRAAARTCDLTLAELDANAPDNPVHVLATCLAARAADRPLLVAVHTPNSASIVPVSVAALAAGAAGVIVRRPVQVDHFPHAEDRAALARLAALRDALPAELGEPEPERTAVLVLAGPDGKRATSIGAVWGTLAFLHATFGLTSGCFFDDRPDAPRPDLVWAPVNGPLSDRAWSLVWSLAAAGSEVVVSRLSLTGPTTLDRLRSLGIEPRPLTAARHGEPLVGSDAGPLLDTEGRALAARPHGGSGRFWFVDWAVERAPMEPRSLVLGAAIAAPTGLRPDPWLGSPGHGLRRTLALPEGDLHFDLDRHTCKLAPRKG